MSARMTFLTRIDPTRNIDRFYVVQVLPTLFGDWTVLREWGRRGSPGTMRTLTAIDGARRRKSPSSARSSAGYNTAIGGGPLGMTEFFPQQPQFVNGGRWQPR